MMKKIFFSIIILLLIILEGTIVNAAVTDRQLAIANMVVNTKLQSGSKINLSQGIFTYANRSELNGWYVEDYTSGSVSNAGLTAMAIVKGNDIIVAYDGTDTEWLEDALCGITSYHTQEPYADTYINKIMEKYNKKGSTYTLYITGHSLGGFLAQTSGVTAYNNQSKYTNVKLGRVATINSMCLGVLQNRVSTINTLKKMQKEGKLYDYCVYGDVVSAMGIHYGEVRTFYPSIDDITYYREKYSISSVSDTTLTNKIKKLDMYSTYKEEFDNAVSKYGMKSISGYLKLTHACCHFCSLGITNGKQSVKIYNSSGKEISGKVTINSNTTFRAKTWNAAAKTYTWYVSSDKKNWKKVQVSSVIDNTSTTTVPTNTYELKLSDINNGETKYIKVVSYYDDAYTPKVYENGTYKEKSEVCKHHGTVEKIITVTRNGTSTSTTTTSTSLSNTNIEGSTITSIINIIIKIVKVVIQQTMTIFSK